MENEVRANNEIRESLEKAYRLIYDQIDNKWQYYESTDIKDEREKRRLATLGVNRNWKGNFFVILGATGQVHQLCGVHLKLSSCL